MTQMKTWQKDTYHKVKYKRQRVVDKSVTRTSKSLICFSVDDANKRKERHGGVVQKSTKTLVQAFAESEQS